jgi:HB1, ASXL, restriction endonuclease HTH domain
MAKKNTTKQKVVAADATPAKAKKSKPEPKPKRMSAIDAAAKVLTDAGTPMNCQELIAVMAAKKLWTSPGGQTPNATLYSAIAREINTKGQDARFQKTERGKFATKA